MGKNIEVYEISNVVELPFVDALVVVSFVGEESQKRCDAFSINEDNCP